MKSNSAPLHLFHREAARVIWRARCAGLAALALLPLVTVAQTITSAVPGYITYQGKVSNAAGALVGAGTPVNRTIVFRIWSHQNNSTVNDLVYSEQQTVTISEGEFSVLIGQGSALSASPLGYSESAKGPPTTTLASAAVFGGATRYLGVTIDDPATSADPEVSPRQQLVTSAYSFRAKYAETVGTNGANSLTALDNGNVGIGTGNPGAKLEVTGSIRAGGAGTPTAALSLLANSATAQAMSIGYSSSIGTYSTDAAAGDTVMRTENGGKLLFQTGVGASALSISSNNYVGIANSNPAALLHIGTGANAASAGLLINTGWINTANYAENRPLDVRVAGSSYLVVNTQGHVGIGTSTPVQRLDVAGVGRANSFVATTGSAAHDQGAWLEWNKDGTGMTHLLNQRGLGPGGIIFGEVTTANVVTERMRIAANGRVGIGTNSPAATLHVHGVGTVSGNLSYYIDGFGHGGPWGANPYTRSDVSIYTSNSIVAQAGFFIISDARTKNVLGVSDGKADLDTLSRIRITNYTFRDVPVLGPRVHKKVIAQQLEQVFPEAVSQFTEVVADIYQPATISDGWIQLTTDLRPGERVRLITEAGTKDLHQVLEVRADGFRTASPPAGNKVFVYGREVSDFRNVDYDAISMLNVSATQELKREKDAEVAALRTANAELVAAHTALERRLADIEAKDRARDAKLAAIEKLLSSGQTVMARPTATNANGQD